MTENIMNIEFIPVENFGQGCVEPIPAIKQIPKWYKKMTPLRRFLNIDDENEKKDYTVKKCIPVLDAFTTGYYLVTKYDSYWNVDEDGTHECKCDAKLIEGGNKPITMHPYEQIRDIELGGVYNEYAYKFTNPYLIKTPPGYSCIFTHPFNQVSPFLTLTGVVDTDMHPLAVQFPFLMMKNYEGVIKKGTPIVQIIPFKRDEWTYSINKPNTLDVQESSLRHSQFESGRYNSDGDPTGGEYKNKYRIKKKYL
jgi:hypothetical protein